MKEPIVAGAMIGFLYVNILVYILLYSDKYIGKEECLLISDGIWQANTI